MKTIDVVVSNPTGLHARPAKTFVGLAKEFQSEIFVEHGEKKVNAKSILSVLTLGVAKGTTIRIFAEGEDEETAIESLAEAIQNGLGE